MKLRTFYLPLAAILFLLTSCLKDTYRHQVKVFYPTASGVLFADQQSDSISFTTFDSYSVTCSESWLEVLNSKDHPSSAKLDNYYNSYYVVTTHLKAEPNTTQKCRLGTVYVRSYSTVDDWDQTGGAYYYQLAWHNVLYPFEKYEYDTNSNVVGATFARTDTCIAVTDSLKFITYDNWTLEVPEGSFASVSTLSGKAGEHHLPVQLTANEGTEERSTTLTLKTDNGVSTPITFKQKAPQKK